ncbi:DUF4189 domain-containing protein [Methylosinus sp. H3A]|uniref:DUF4189 domain-containing protein n=1 Tax=Methylosinus sp. H3A TaxID=2785786 RepID=UPI0018C2A8D3|nr:DUF4189 domain-containing protein [Methylosinus sp. H3A]MBG0807948.1 DUF4189 domain-containing protein [Methylosinus sp. H3A]
MGFRRGSACNLVDAIDVNGAALSSRFAFHSSEDAPIAITSGFYFDKIIVIRMDIKSERPTPGNLRPVLRRRASMSFPGESPRLKLVRRPPRAADAPDNSVSHAAPLADRPRPRRTVRASAVFAAIAVLSAAPHAVWADEAGNSAICRQQCNYDGNGNNGSCYWACMASRQSYDNAPSSTLSPSPGPPTLFGAIAVETGTLITGFAKDYSSRADAERRAIAMCRRAGGSAAGCKIAVWGHNSCLALATSPASGGGRNSWGYAWSDDGFVSRRKAMAACSKDGGADCKVAVTFCTG